MASKTCIVFFLFCLSLQNRTKFPTSGLIRSSEASLIKLLWEFCAWSAVCRLLFTCRITQTSNLKSFKLFEELSLGNHSRCVCLCLTLIVSTCCCCCCYFCCSALWQSYLSDTLHSFAIRSRFLSYQATLKCLAQILDSWFLSSLHWECRRQTVYSVGTTQWKPSGAAFLVTKTRCVIIITDRQQSWPWVVKQQNSWTVQQFNSLSYV